MRSRFVIYSGELATFLCGDSAHTARRDATRRRTAQPALLAPFDAAHEAN